jgi:hypothetical protein
MHRTNSRYTDPGEIVFRQESIESRPHRILRFGDSWVISEANYPVTEARLLFSASLKTPVRRR